MSAAPLHSDIYIISSDDPLLKLDRSQELMKQGRKLLPEAEFFLYTYSDLQGAGGSGANLKSLENELADPGLFGGDRLIKIILKDFDNTAVEVFNLLASSNRPGIFVIIDIPRMNSKYLKAEAKDPSHLKHLLSFAPGSAGEAAFAAQNSGKKGKVGKGAKPSSAAKGGKRATGAEAKKSEAVGYLKGIGAHFELLYPPEGAELPQWIRARAKRYGLTIQEDALDFIARSCENNLMTIDQSLQLMQLLRLDHNPVNAVPTIDGQVVSETELDSASTDSTTTDSTALGSAAPGTAIPGSAAPGTATPGSAIPGSAAPAKETAGTSAPTSLAPLTLVDVETYFTQDSRYTGFELPIAILQNDTLKALNIISSFCSGQGANMSSALSLLLARMDESLATIYDGKEQSITSAPSNEQFAFFMAHNIKLSQAQDLYKKAIREMSLDYLNFLNKCLSEATQAYSTFDNDGAYLALQRLAASRDPRVVNLSPSLILG